MHGLDGPSRLASSDVNFRCTSTLNHSAYSAATSLDENDQLQLDSRNARPQLRTPWRATGLWARPFAYSFQDSQYFSRSRFFVLCSVEQVIRCLSIRTDRVISSSFFLHSSDCTSRLLSAAARRCLQRSASIRPPPPRRLPAPPPPQASSMVHFFVPCDLGARTTSTSVIEHLSMPPESTGDRSCTNVDPK